MSKIVTVKQDDKTKDCYLDLEDFKDFVDVKKVKQYTMEVQKDKSLILTFFDKNGKKLSLKKQDLF